jgi:hypothetical protein
MALRLKDVFGMTVNGNNYPTDEGKLFKSFGYLRTNGGDPTGTADSLFKIG